MLGVVGKGSPSSPGKKKKKKKKKNLLEYLDLAFATRSWLSNHNSVVCNPILLYYCKDFQWRLFQLYTDFQLIALSGLPSRREN